MYFSIRFLHEAKLSKYLVGLLVQGGQGSGGSRVFLVAQRDLAIHKAYIHPSIYYGDLYYQYQHDNR
jgi:hypothetical protein